MSYILGVDFDTNAIHAVCISEDDDDGFVPVYEKLELTGPDAFTRTRQVRTRVADVMGGRWHDVLAVGIEHPAGTHGSQVLMRVQGAVLACIPTTILVQDWPPGSWRKAVGLPGNSNKAAVFDWANNHRLMNGKDPAVVDWPQDACDAYCIALATRAVLRTGQAKVA